MKNTEQFTKEAVSLVNDLAIEFSVGGDRFTPSDIAPMMRSLVPEGKEDAFRDAVRARYKEMVPSEHLDEDGLAFLEREIRIWCSDDQFKLGEIMSKIEYDPDDYNNELNSADSFRLVSDGIVAAVFHNHDESFELVLFSKDGVRLPAEGVIRSVDYGTGTGVQIPDFKIENGILTANVTIYDGKDGSDPNTERYHSEMMQVNAKTGELISCRRFTVFGKDGGKKDNIEKRSKNDQLLDIANRNLQKGGLTPSSSKKSQKVASQNLAKTITTTLKRN